MRPFRKFHDNQTRVGEYLASGQILSGSIPETALGRVMRWFPLSKKPDEPRLVHITLSLPIGQQLSDDDWHKVALHVLEKSGLPANEIPWIMSGREPTKCDHVHILAGLRTWLGRSLELTTSVRSTDMLERDLRHRLGLAELEWLQPSKTSLVSPIRALHLQNRTPEMHFANDFNFALERYLPTSLEELNAALGRVGSDWTVANSIERAGLLTTVNKVSQLTINPKNAGAHFSSQALLSRLAFAHRIVVAHAAQFISALARAIDIKQIPTQMKDDSYDRLQVGPRNSDDEDGPCERGYSETLPALGAVAAARPRPDKRIRGTSDELHDRDPAELPKAKQRVSGDEIELRNDQPKAGSSSGRGPRRDGVGRGQWLIKLRLLARALRLRLALCFTKGKDTIQISDADGGMARLQLHTLHITQSEYRSSSQIEELIAAACAKYDIRQTEVNANDLDEASFEI